MSIKDIHWTTPYAMMIAFGAFLGLATGLWVLASL